jgi:sulfur carrier protein
MPLTVTLNGQSRTFPNLVPQTTLGELVQELGLKGDRVAIEHNGEIAPRTSWSEVRLQENDRLEVVHFVGGGAVESKGM